MTRRPVSAILGAVVVVTVVGCGSSTPAPSGAPGLASAAASAGAPPSPAAPSVAASPIVIPATADQALTYGSAPTRDPAVTYQPDVVFVEGGPGIVRWVSANGVTWAIDGNAPGAADLRVGSVMFATSRAVGRVAAIRDDGDARIVTLAPISLTDLVRDAHLVIDQSFDIGSMAYQPLADNPGTISIPGPLSSDDPTATDAPPTGGGGPAPSGPAGTATKGAATETTVELPAIRLVASTSPAVPTLSVAAKTCPEVTLRTWVVKPCVKPGGVSLEIASKAVPGLKAGGKITLISTGLHTKVDMSIVGGLFGKTSVTVDGLSGWSLSLFGGVADGAKDNAKVKIEVPVETFIPLAPVAGLPMTAYGEFKLIFTTALSGKNSTLQTVGLYSLTGPFGMVDGSVVAPKMSVVDSIVDAMQGITLGPSGFVFAGRFKFQVGLGMPGMVAGPYTAITISVGISKGSVIGSPIADCRSATFGLWIAGGVGAQVNAEVLKLFLPKDIAKLKSETEVSTRVLSLTRTTPDVAVCRG